MLQKKERLNRDEFNHFFLSGTRRQGRFLQVVYTPYPTFHASVVVSKKVAAKAVVRNTLRRCLYNTLRHMRKDTHGVFIIIMKPAAAHVEHSLLQKELIELVGRYGNTG